MHTEHYAGRFWRYLGEHGFRATARRVALGVSRVFRGNSLVLFYCDLPTAQALPLDAPLHGTAERKTSEASIDTVDMQRITSVGYPSLVRRKTLERLERGANLWLWRIDNGIAAYGWSIVGRTIEPYFFPLGPADVHLFDFYVFPEMRGLKINCLLMENIMQALSTEKRQRVFIEAAEWNTPQLRSLSKTRFQKLGNARKFVIGGRIMVVWSHKHV
jgi:hypothetical protein